jgi:hypothetical protein
MGESCPWRVDRRRRWRRIARATGQVIGREVKTEYVSEQEFQEHRGNNPLLASQGWVRDGWLDVDMQEVRQYGIELGTLKGFLEREKDALARGFDD